MKLISKSIKYISIFFVAAVLVSCGNKNPKEEAPTPTKQTRQLDYTGEVSFVNVAGEVVSTVDVAIADEQKERNEGLMDITDLPPDAGMLFTFPEEEPLSFWMANTPLSLDIIFVNADSSIVRIHHSTTPYSDKNLTSDVPAQYVVETNGGYCISHDIKEGMNIRF